MPGALSVTLVYPVMKTIAQKGFQVEAFFESVRFDVRRLQQADGKMESKELEQLVEAAAQYTGDEHFGLSQGMMMEFADLGVLGYVIAHASTVGGALHAYRRYQRILMNCSLDVPFHIADDVLEIRFVSEAGASLSRHCMEEMMVGMSRLIKALVMRPVTLKQVCFAHERQGGMERYREAFAVEPQFGSQVSLMRLDAELIDCPIIYSSPQMLQIFEQKAREAMERMLTGKVISDRVVAWMHNCMPSYFPSLEQTAREFHMSRRSLQQKLAQEGETYVKLAEQVKKELAIQWLKQRQLSIGEIAYYLHFAEPSSFQNAFKRWTGTTPGQYRTELL